MREWLDRFGLYKNGLNTRTQLEMRDFLGAATAGRLPHVSLSLQEALKSLVGRQSGSGIALLNGLSYFGSSPVLFPFIRASRSPSSTISFYFYYCSVLI